MEEEKEEEFRGTIKERMGKLEANRKRVTIDSHHREPPCGSFNYSFLILGCAAGGASKRVQRTCEYERHR